MVHTLKLMLAVVCTFVFTTAALAKDWNWSGEIRTFQSGQILELLQQEAHDRAVAQAATERTGTFGAWEWAKAPVGLKRWITPHTRSVINSLEVELPEGVSTLPRTQLLNLFLAETYLLRVAFSDLDPRQGRLALDEVKPGDELFLLSPNADQARLESQIAAWLEERERRRQEAEPITLGEARQLVEEMLAEMDADDLTGLDFRAVIRAELEALQEEGQLTSVDLEDATNEALFGDDAPALNSAAITTALTSVRERMGELEARMDQAEADIRDHEQRLNNLEDVNLPEEVRSILTELDLIDADGQPIRGSGTELSETQTAALTWVADLQRADGSFPEFVTTEALDERLNDYATQEELDAVRDDIPDVSNFATRDELSQATSWRGYTLWQWLLGIAVGLLLIAGAVVFLGARTTQLFRRVRRHDSQLEDQRTLLVTDLADRLDCPGLTQAKIDGLDDGDSFSLKEPGAGAARKIARFTMHRDDDGRVKHLEVSGIKDTDRIYPKKDRETGGKRITPEQILAAFLKAKRENRLEGVTTTRKAA